MEIAGALCALALLLRLLRLAQPDDVRPPSAAEVAAWILLGLVGAGIAVLVQAPTMLTTAASSSDWLDYCMAVEAVRTLPLGDLHGFGGRIGPVALPAGWLAGPLGIWDGLALASIGANAVALVGVALAARSLGGRQAGVIAPMLALAVPALAIMGRDLTFYPEGAACMALAAGTVLAALRWPSAWTLLLGASGVGLALAAQPIGVITAAPAMAALVLRALWMPGVPVWKRVGALMLPVLASWAVCHLLLPDTMLTGLDTQLAKYIEDTHGPPPPGFQPPPAVQWLLTAPPGPDGVYVWGYGSPLKAIEVLPRILGQALLVRTLPPGSRGAGLGEHAAPAYVTVWLPALGLALFALVARGGRRPGLLLGQLLVLSPFVATLVGAAGGQTWPKTLMAPSLCLPILFAVGVELAARTPRPAPLPAAARLAAAVGLAGLWVLAPLPRGLSRDAPWRLPLHSASHEHATYVDYARLPPERWKRLPEGGGIEVCLAGLQADLQAGHTPWWSDRRRPTGYDVPQTQ